MGPANSTPKTGGEIPPSSWENPKKLWERDAYGWSPISAIIFNRKLADIPPTWKGFNETDPETGDNLLHMSVRWDYLQETTLLLRKGVSPTCKNKANQTPIDLAQEPIPGQKNPNRILILGKLKDAESRQREKAARKFMKDTPEIEL